MARARNIKPGFFKNEDLAELDAFDRLLFIGLWCLADREGRIEDRPKRIKMELFPCDDYKVDAGISNLCSHGFIERFNVGDMAVIEVTNFVKHQNPHGTERDSLLPDSKGFYRVHSRRSNGCVTGSSQLVNVNPTLKNVDPPLDNTLIHRFSDSPNPDSPNPDSPNPDSPNEDQKTLQLVDTPAPVKAKRVAKPKDPEVEAKKEANAKTWQAYADSYFNRYGAEPVRNAKVNGLVAQLVQRLGADEAPHVAFYYVTINDAFYLRTLHDLGNLVAKCESIRTQWATGKQMTGTTARQLENTQSNISAADEAIRMMRDGGIKNAFII